MVTLLPPVPPLLPPSLLYYRTPKCNSFSVTRAATATEKRARGIRGCEYFTKLFNYKCKINNALCLCNCTTVEEEEVGVVSSLHSPIPSNAPSLGSSTTRKQRQSVFRWNSKEVPSAPQETHHKVAPIKYVNHQQARHSFSCSAIGKCTSTAHRVYDWLPTLSFPVPESAVAEKSLIITDLFHNYLWCSLHHHPPPFAELARDKSLVTSFSCKLMNLWTAVLLLLLLPFYSACSWWGVNLLPPF